MNQDGIDFSRTSKESGIIRKALERKTYRYILKDFRYFPDVAKIQNLTALRYLDSNILSKRGEVVTEVLSTLPSRSLMRRTVMADTILFCSKVNLYKYLNFQICSRYGSIVYEGLVHMFIFGFYITGL
ncbi:hypothetical protein CEXT_165461 [Caerostris extrusa]|uniref:Uncharacterized protein n=1 Tax=Caerostris extrusa TaxID=172846 RepID=A0AAV4WUL7_CAEEX|nr:hypothetical protein CEXT_165461 [Caerostris extrusa]